MIRAYTKDRTGTNEGQRYGHSGDAKQYQQDFPEFAGMSDAQMMTHWTNNYSSDWNEQVSQWDKEAQAERLMKKLWYFTAHFYMIEDVAEVMPANAAVSSLPVSYRVFQYMKAAHAAKGVDGLIKAGNALDKGGFTAVGRALQKHGSRTGSIYPKATGNAAAINAQGEAVLKGILTNPNATTVTRHHARFGNIMDIQIPGGQGARFSADGKKFIHFLEP